MELSAMSSLPAAPPASSPSRLPQLSVRGGFVSPPYVPEANILQPPTRPPLKQPPVSALSPHAAAHNYAPFALELAHSNQKDGRDASGVRPASAASPTPTTIGTESALSSFLSPASLSTVDATAASAMVTSACDLEAATDVDVRDVLTDPASPAYQALLKANHEKPDVSLLDKRPRIGHAKLGRHKYKADNRSFKKPAGKEIHTQHEQYALTYGMMCGILNSAGLQNPFKQRLTMDDFMRVDKRVFAPNAKLQHAFKFKDYSPDIFRQIRRRFCIDSADYMVTLCGDFNYIEFMSNSKSGQFFFYSHDGRFMIKTQTKDESKFLRRILPHYYKFVMENPNTLVTRFYGMHRVKMHHLRRKMHFIIMASVFDTPLEIHARFDLKGSTVGRYGTPKDKLTHGVLKDMDLVDSAFRLEVGAEKRAMLLVQIRKDVEFLKRMKIMDYSLLLGVHDARGQIQKKIYGTAQPEQPVTKSLPTTPVGETPDAAFANGELPVRLARSMSVPDDSRLGDRECMPTPSTPLGYSATAAGYDVDDFDAEFDSDSDDSCSDESSHRSDSDSFAIDDSSAAATLFAVPSHSNVLTPSSLRTAPSMASSLHAMEPISPRALDVARFPGHSESVFCKDQGGIFGRDGHGRKNGLVYFVGVIDILQQYNTRKIAETFFKGFRHNRKEISAVNPVYYGDRFVEFMEKYVILDDSLPPSRAAASVNAKASAVPLPGSPARPSGSSSTLQQL